MSDNNDFQHKPIPLPNGHDKALLHSCCAPCSGEVMEARLASGINYTIFSTTPTSIRARNTNCVRMKVFALRKNLVCRLSMLIMTATTGLNVHAAWRINLSVAFVAPCVLICVLSARHFMPMNMGFR